MDDLQLYVAICDVDDLKKTNDTFGHDEGDNQLCLAVNRLKVLCPTCYIFRLGGDEFLLLSFEDFREDIRDILGVFIWIRY